MLNNLKDKLTEATMLALQNKLIEAKNMVNSEAFSRIDSEYHAEYWGARAGYGDIQDVFRNTEDTESAINQLLDMKNNIDTEVTTYEDYSTVDEKLVPFWLNAYKDVIDNKINDLRNKNKYYIELLGDYEDEGDVEHKGTKIAINNGVITRDTQYFDTRTEAEKALSSVSNSDLEEFRKQNLDSNYKPLIQWNVEIKQFIPDVI